MKITVLDGYTENPGDLSWDWLEALGETSIYDCTPDGLIAERSAGCEIIITNKTPLRRETLEKLPELRYIGLLSTGYNVVDWEYCKKGHTRLQHPHLQHLGGGSAHLCADT